MQETHSPHHKLQSKGHRLTHQRRILLDILLAEEQEHLDADKLYQRARRLDPHIGLATVYRALALFKEAGLIIEHRLGQEHGHFEAAPERPHYHFTCQVCGRVIEFESSDLTALVQAAPELVDADIQEIHISILGVCANCGPSQQLTQPGEHL